MTTPPTDTGSSHPRKARSKIASGRVLLTGFADGAARRGDMAMFQTAHDFTIVAPGKEPKTPRGTHVEFARLAKDNDRVPRAMAQVLGTTYKLKAAADEAKASLDTAKQFIATISSVLTPTR